MLTLMMQVPPEEWRKLRYGKRVCEKERWEERKKEKEIDGERERERE